MKISSDKNVLHKLRLLMNCLVLTLCSRTITGTVGLNKLLSSLNQEVELNDYDGKGTLQ